MAEGKIAPQQGVETEGSSHIKEQDKEPAIPSPFEKRLGTTLAERHPDWPQVKLKFFFSPHITSEDMLGMKDHISNGIYIFMKIQVEIKILNFFRMLQI